MKLFDVFSDNALFQAGSTLTLRGISEPGTNIFARLLGFESSVHGKCVCPSNGIFEVTIDTPPASYNKYEIEVTDGDNTIILKNILFGELWVASGQSNMELANANQFECDEFLDSINNFDIRVFSQENGRQDCFSKTPENETCGKWVSSLDSESVKCVSACASAFCKTICKYFAEVNKKIPVGFLNVSWGGTPIYGWLSEEAILSDSVAMENLIKRNLFPSDNMEIDFQHPCIMYNRKIAPIRGIKARGLLWYQGEFDSYSEYSEHIYKRFLYLLHDSYAEMFAKDKNKFTVISSLVFPCNYTDSGDTQVGYLNDAFVTATKEHPETYLCVPTYDLPPSWWPLDTNHPIHPLHKYALGDRMARIALANIYGGSGQKLPSLLRSWHVDGNRMVLSFDNTQKGLYTNDGKHIRGMYIAGSDKVYMPADCEIISDCEIAVSHPYLDKPCHCLYGWSSLEVNLNLFSGDFPILPFATDNNGDDLIKIELKSFLNFEVMSELEWYEDSSHTGEWYYRPVWKPLADSNVCIDNAFTMKTEGYNVSISVDSLNSTFGIYTEAHDGHTFDFQNYSSLEIDIFHCGLLTFDTILEYANGNGIKLCAKFTGDSSMYFKHYSVDFSDIPDGIIKKMSFVFTVDNCKLLKHINIGRLYLKPKKQ